jgi:hypothetical protein
MLASDLLIVRSLAQSLILKGTWVDAANRPLAGAERVLGRLIEAASSWRCYVRRFNASRGIPIDDRDS